MELNHFSHSEHPLILKEIQEDHSTKVVCYGCEQPIVSGSTYSCSECKVFLHKSCAELPLEITHPMHPEHPLELFSESPYWAGSCHCDICAKPSSNFTYHCTKCKFDVHVLCAQLEGIFEHTSHQETCKHPSHLHPLKLQQRSASFKCDACGMKEEDQSYYCTVCSFWIHKTCGSLPNSSSHKDHPHPLSLAYCLPKQYRHYELNCEICLEKLRPSYWVYYCGPCRHFIHLKCMTSQKSKEDEAVEANSNGEIRLPVEDLSSLLIRHFSEQNGLPQIELSTEINHFSHKHPMILSTIQDDYSEMSEDDQETMCNGCAEPITDSCYSCAPCNYYLHLHCAQLPKEVSHPKHPDHKLSLSHRQAFFSLFMCVICGGYSNGFFYECKECDFLVDIKCALFPTSIKHEAHNHRLVRNDSVVGVCNACNLNHATLGFGCASCNYNLAIECAMLPRTVRHRWDEHPLILSLPPFYYHPDEFICDICEEEIHPKFWLYHCRECDNSFHTYCIPRLGGWHRNVKFGGKLQIDSHHPHSLTFAREVKCKFFCDNCGTNLKGRMAFECEACYFYICQPCAWKIVRV